MMKIKKYKNQIALLVGLSLIFFGHLAKWERSVSSFAFDELAPGILYQEKQKSEFRASYGNDAAVSLYPVNENLILVDIIGENGAVYRCAARRNGLTGKYMVDSAPVTSRELHTAWANAPAEEAELYDSRTFFCYYYYWTEPTDHTVLAEGKTIRTGFFGTAAIMLFLLIFYITGSCLEKRKNRT